MDYGYIYKTINLKNGKVYIGQRRGEFVPSYYGSGTIIKRAVQKNGTENFQVTVLRNTITKEEANLLEKKYIAEHRESLGKDNLYNIADGGEGGKFPHKINCDCGWCKSQRGEGKHRIDCDCGWCKVTRGELQTSGMTGKHQSKESIAKTIENRRNNGRPWCSDEMKEKLKQYRWPLGKKWVCNIKLKQSKQVMLSQVEQYLAEGWSRGRIGWAKHV